MKAILSSAYLGNIEYYTVLCTANQVIIETNDRFQKQTYRNRCSIYGANGKLNLSIPIEHASKSKKMKDVCISYSENWQKLHWKSIESAYRSSPYFEYYENEFKNLFTIKTKLLLEFNTLLQNKVLELLQLNPKITYSNLFNHEYPYHNDLREKLNPKKVSSFQHQSYIQVFSSKYGHIPNLSIIDLLFNEGPNSVTFLNNGIS